MNSSGWHQVPQFILEQRVKQQEPVRIIVTQPRKIAAKSVAEVRSSVTSILALKFMQNFANRHSVMFNTYQRRLFLPFRHEKNDGIQTTINF